MDPREKDLKQKMEEDKDDATERFPNAQNSSAAEINRGTDPNQKNYMGKANTGQEGPNWDKKSENSDGDTSQNAGVFK